MHVAATVKRTSSAAYSSLMMGILALGPVCKLASVAAWNSQQHLPRCHTCLAVPSFKWAVRMRPIKKESAHPAFKLDCNTLLPSTSPHRGHMLCVAEMWQTVALRSRQLAPADGAFCITAAPSALQLHLIMPKQAV